VVKFGVHTGLQQTSTAELRSVWSHAEALGFEWLSIWDHFYPSTIPLDDPCHEAVATHAALAVSTSRTRVGSLVYSAGYRHPAVLANAMATIDHLSEGRLEFGIGAGWHQAEYAAYGILFESPAVRLRRLQEAVEVIRALWSKPEVSYDGEFFTLRSAYCSPKPVQTAPRIWIGASGEKIGLPLAGRLGDAWNTPFPSPEDFVRKRQIVLEHAPNPDEFTVGVNVGLLGATEDGAVDQALRARFGPGADAVRPSTVAGSPSRMAHHVAKYVDAGADWVILAMRPPFELDALERFALEVTPQFQSSGEPT
jgi:alkanesulfonate monooxygenase SsuD/methylene tetrahydromethanopterin reductase-like flavin-dependent oxidoreductase (luciferase family)